MKKSLIALAVAGALTAPMVAQADATLYGSLRVAFVDNDTESGLKDNASRIGIRGSSDLFSGAKAIFQFEQGVNTEDGMFGSGRLANVGITGDFGTALFGRIWTPYYNWTAAQTDILDNGTTGSTYSQVTSIHRTPDTIAYVSPDMNGFQAAVAVLAIESDASAEDETVDASHVAAKYSANGLHFGISYLDFNDDGILAGAEEDITSVAVSYEMGDLYVAARYEDRDMGAAEDQDGWDIAASYTMGNTTLLANYGEDDSASEDEFYSVEVQQKLGAQARVFGAITQYDSAKDSGFEVGYRVDF